MRSLLLGTVVAVLQLSNALRVYLHPPRDLSRSVVSPGDASLLVSQHLGLEMFEYLSDASRFEYNNAVQFVAKGTKGGVILAMEEQDAKIILPPSMKSSFTASSKSSVSWDSVSSILTTYVDRAKRIHSVVEDARPASWELKYKISMPSNADFVAMDFSELSELRKEYSEEDYFEGVSHVRSFIQDSMSSKNVVILVYSSPAKRAILPRQSQTPLPVPPPQSPIGSISTCFMTEASCTNATSSCSGRGECIKATKDGASCFECSCRITKTGEGLKVKTEKWVGESCERKDVSGPFTLIIGTVVLIIFLIYGSVSLLTSVGDAGLPSTLMASAIGGKRD